MPSLRETDEPVIHRGSACALLFLLSSACAAPPAAPPDRLPFHVAVVPVEVQRTDPAELGIWDSDSMGEVRPDEVAFEASFESGAVSPRLVAELNGIFARTTELEAPAEEGWAQRPLEERARYWADAAGAAGTDLVLVPTLRYDPRVATETNGLYWLNLPLFLLGGPLAWFVNDRSYELPLARLEIGLHDASAIAISDGATLQNNHARIHFGVLEFERASLDLIDRAGGSVPPYLYSILIPPGHLASTAEGARESLQEAVVEILCRHAGDDLLDSAQLIVGGGEGATSYRPQRLRVAQGALQGGLRGELLLRVGSSLRMKAFGYWIDGEYFEEPFLEEDVRETADGGRSYGFTIPLAASGDRDWLRVRFIDAAGATRSFTFPITDPVVRRPSDEDDD